MKFVYEMRILLNAGAIKTRTKCAGLIFGGETSLIRSMRLIAVGPIITVSIRAKQFTLFF